MVALLANQFGKCIVVTKDVYVRGSSVKGTWHSLSLQLFYKSKFYFLKRGAERQKVLFKKLLPKCHGGCWTKC